MTDASASGGLNLGSLQTPLAITNRPGLAAISYRAGGHAAFKQSMLTQLATQLGLHTHEDTDFTVAFIDAVAAMGEVLTFYQERIANESYVRTATERRSLVELARLIAYEPRPGVAAGVFLAFTLESAPGAPDQAAQPITLAAGLKAQSLPDPGQPPLSFETIAPIEARPEWNAIGVRMTQPQPIATTMPSVLVNGAATGVQPGDILLIVDDQLNEAALRCVAATADPVARTTRIDIVANPPDPPSYVIPDYPIAPFFIDPLPLEDILIDRRVFGLNWRQHDFAALARVQRWSFRDLRFNFRRRIAHPVLPAQASGVFAFGQKAAVFGHNAPLYSTLAQTKGLSDWDTTPRTLEQDSNGSRQIDLDRVYSGIIPGSYVILESETDQKIYRVENVFEISRADFTLSGKLTRLQLDSDDGFDTFTVRGATVHLQSQALDLADLPIVDPVAGATVILDGPYLELAVGQTVILTGARTDLVGVVASEAVTISDIQLIDGYSVVTFVQSLANPYERGGVAINANVAPATHGETVREVLGSGDSSQAFQSFSLLQSPLTYVSSPDPSGAASTLRVSVNGLPWTQAPQLFGAGPADPIYVAQTDDAGQTTVRFGDGSAGARPATGVENITATYRKGMGSAGNVDAGKIMLLPARPLGVRAVANPVAASGATDAESLLDIRRNAALPILTLDRIVSLQDYEDFARAFTGVAKALATWSWIGRTRGVFVTVAGSGGAAISTDGQTYGNLLAAMRTAGDPNVPLRVQSFRDAFFRLAATITLQPGAVAGATLMAVETALRGAFAFDTREFGQSVAISEVLAVIQGVTGVRAAQVTQFFRTDDPNGGGLATGLAAAAPMAATARHVLAAELLTLDPRPLDLVGVAA